MRLYRPSRRGVLKSIGAGAAALIVSRLPLSFGDAPDRSAIQAGLASSGHATGANSGKGDIQGFRENIDHIVVIYQENRSFDHYFGTYQSPSGAAVDTLLDADGKIDARYHGLQKNPAGIPYSTLPVPSDVPGFETAQLPNAPFHLAPYIPATHNVPWDPSHNFFRMLAQINGGRMDQFVALALVRDHPPFKDLTEAARVRTLLAESKPSGAVLGYYTRDDVPGYHALADGYVLFDSFFQAISGGSTANALYLVAGRTAQSSKAPKAAMGDLATAKFDMPFDSSGMMINDLPPVNGPTEVSFDRLSLSPPPEEQTYPNIGDMLSAKGIDWAWYNEDWNSVERFALKTAFGPGDGSAVLDSIDMYVPHHNPFQYFPSWNDNVRTGRMRDVQDFFADVKSGKLPAVSFLKATGAHDEHPADSAPQWGEQWVMGILKALGDSRLWSRSLVMITYDEGGGFWDHVAPPRPDPYGCGTRIPALMVSPFARPGYVDHRVADTTSVLSMIRARFGLKPLQRRDALAYNLLDGLDFEQDPRDLAVG